MHMRLAVEADLPAILGLLSADPISASRAGQTAEVSERVRQAFSALQVTDDHALWVAEANGEVVGTYQLSMLPGLARDGMWRALVESVHVRADQRGMGVGERMMRHAIEQARARGCGLLQLTSDKRRTDAHRFYQRLGFVASHEGMKLALE